MTLYDQMGAWVYGMGTQLLAGNEIVVDRIDGNLQDLCSTFTSIDYEGLDTNDQVIYWACQEKVQSITAMVREIFIVCKL